MANNIILLLKNLKNILNFKLLRDVFGIRNMIYVIRRCENIGF